ncbi:MAG: porin PorA family protein [Thermoplasmatota archaeon]
MSGIKTILAVGLIIAALIMAGIGGGLMFYLVPTMEDEAEFPEDFDHYFTYGGYIKQLNFTSADYDNDDFTIERHIVNTGKTGDNYLVEETVTAYRNDTGWTEQIDDLNKYHEYTVHPKRLQLYKVDDTEGYMEEYTEDDDVQWVFPIPVEKKDYTVWSMNLLDTSTAYFDGEEKRGGVNCYVFWGKEENWTLPLPDELAAGLPKEIAENTTFELEIWEKVWVHPLSGTIVDYTKDLRYFLTLPPLPEVPEIKYPSDLVSVTGFGGTIVLFDQATGTFNTLNGATAVRTLEVTSADNYTLTASDSTEVFDPLGNPIPLLSSTVEAMFHSATGAHDGMGRTGQYLFPPTGVEMINYTMWDDGFGAQITAVFIGMDTETFAPLTAYEYNILEEELPYLAGGIGTLNMTYWVEPETGIVLDVVKQFTNWRPQPARRLPADTAMINKTVYLNTTIEMTNPIEGPGDPMVIVVEQMINCTGYTDATFSVAKIRETMTKMLPDGTPIETPSTVMFGVNAVSMEYVDVDGWSTVSRDGHFTFPVGLLNESGNITEEFEFYNSDLDMSFPLILTDEVEVGGIPAAEYHMILADLPLSEVHLEMILGEKIEIPGIMGKYACDFKYVVDIDTGTILDVDRSMKIDLVPPSYEQLYKTMNTNLTLKGQISGENVTYYQFIKGEDGGDDVAIINITSYALYDNETEFISPGYSEFPINITSHEVLYENGTGTETYWTFPADPTAKSAYPMMQKFEMYQLFGIAMLEGTDTGIATYKWTNTSVFPGEYFSPLLTGLDINTTISYVWDIDAVSGSILNITGMIDLQTPLGWMNNTFETSEKSLEKMVQSNVVTLWAMDGDPITVLEVSSLLSADDKAMAQGKAIVTQGLLKVADGIEPALDLTLSFNATTKETMKQTALATKAQLALIPGLMILKGMKMVLESRDNLFIHAYYTQVEEDVEGVSDGTGSVEYWGDFCKDLEDELQLFGTTIPIALYAGAAILIVAAVALILTAGKPPGEEDEEEETGEGEEPEEETEEEEGEGGEE